MDPTANLTAEDINRLDPFRYQPSLISYLLLRFIIRDDPPKADTENSEQEEQLVPSEGEHK